MNVTSGHRVADWALGASRNAAFTVSVLTVLGVAAAFLNGVPTLIQIFIAISVVAFGGHAVRRLLFPAVSAVMVEGQQVRMRFHDGSSKSGTLNGTPFVSPVFVGFRWSPQSSRLPHALGIFRGQMSATDYRRLCATLRQQGE
ncbi:MAG: hypothetical protein U5L08_04985 [Xanthomonadales bacterium]|nr:hypothetical protein [Xanthomonadales bacterium]